MKRSIITALAATLVLGTTMAADAVRQDRLAEDAQAIEQAWTAWALGGSSNALLAEDFCGEIVEGKFFLTVPLGSGATELDCTIPSGMQAVASPFGAFSWAPTDGKTGTKLFNATFGYLKGVEPKAVKVVVDGSALPKGPMLCSLPFDISLEPGNSLQQLDPQVKGDSTKVVTCGWFYLVGPLSPGSHTIDMAGRVKGSDGFSLRYNVTVT